MKKILIILGGGRKKGNTAQLVDAFMKGAMEAGHATELISLNQLQVNGCIGCNACRYGKPCVQKDDFNSLVPKILGSGYINVRRRKKKYRYKGFFQNRIILIPSIQEDRIKPCIISSNY